MAQSSWLAAVQWWLRATLWAQEERPRRLAEACGDALSPAQTVPIPTAFGDHPGSDEVLIVFEAIENGSNFRMTYEAFPTNEIRIFSLYLTPISLVVCIVALVVGVCLAVATYVETKAFRVRRFLGRAGRPVLGLSLELLAGARWISWVLRPDMV